MRCPQCSTENPDGFRFCGACGHQLDAAPPGGDADAARTLYFGQMQAPDRAKLVLIKGEAMDGVAYHLQGREHVAGRTEGEIRFPDDPLLSPRHACFYYDNGQLLVRDEGSLNGIFVRITKPMPLIPGARFLVGEQLLQLEEVGESAAGKPDAQGTFFYGGPRRPGHFKLVQILRGGEIGMIFRAPTEEVILGREGNDVNFPDDPFISGQHASVRAAGGTYTLTDLGSKNGTFVAIPNVQPLEHGDYVFLGQQLLRVEIT